MLSQYQIIKDFFQLPTMSRVVESSARREMRVTLTNLTRKIASLEVKELDLQQLKDLNIHVEPMTLDETSPDRPSYFAPHPGCLIPEPDDDLRGAYKGLDDETDPASHRPVDRAYWMDVNLARYIAYYAWDAKGERAHCVAKK